MVISIESAAPVGEAISGGPEVLESLAPEWRQLCDEGVWTQDPFCRPEWSIAYARAYEAKNVVAVTARIDGRLCAVLPLIRERGFLWGVPATFLRRAADQARFDLALTSDEIGATEAVPALWSCLRDDLSWDVIELANVPESAALWRLKAEAEKDGFLTGYQRCFRTPILSLTGLPERGEDPWLAATSQRFRHELRRKTRRLQERGQLRLERHDCASPEVLEQFYALERSTWKGDRGCAVVSDSRRLRYFNEIARELGQLGYLSVFFLTLEDQAVAASIVLTYAGRFFGLRCAFDPEFSSYSPGQILINWMLRDCAAHHFSELDFMGEAFEYKLQWTSQTLEHGYCYIFRRGLFGRALHALKFWAVPLGRKLLRRRLPDY